MKRSTSILLAGLVLAGCDLGDPGQHGPEPTVEAWLVAGEPLPPVRVTWTQDIDLPYGTAPVGIDSATVTVTLLGQSGETVRIVTYQETDVRGTYEPVRSGVGDPLFGAVTPGATYALRVEIPDQQPVTATTTVPGAFQVQDVQNRSFVYQSTEQVEIDVTKSSYPGREAVYIIAIESLEPSIEGLTPFILDVVYDLSEGEEFDPDDLDPQELEDVIHEVSPPLNEANWEELPGGDLRLKMPWFFVSFFGKNEITVSAIDDNIWNLLRGLNAQEGAGGLAPGEIPNVKAGVTGGHGMFGSLTRVRSTVDILRE